MSLFEFDKSIGLLITMHDEYNTVYNTLTNVMGDCKYIGIAQSGDTKAKEIEDLLGQSGRFEEGIFTYRTLPNLGDKYSKWELPSRAVCRNYSHLFSDYKKANVCDEADADYMVCITGDTLLWNLWGIDTIIDGMIEKGCNVGCARAFNESFHSDELTLEHFESGGDGGGRLQDSSNDDFMPQMFVVGKDLVGAYSDISITNKWCSEQCLGDTMNKSKGLPYIFAWEAYGFADGVVYNYKGDTV